jgi:hypothetical protein
VAAALLAGVALADRAEVATETVATATREPGIRRERFGVTTLTTAVLPGRVVDLARARPRDGVPRLVVLVRLSEGDTVEGSAPSGEDAVPAPRKLPACPRSPRLALYRLEGAEPPRLDVMMDGLPEDVAQVDLADLDGDGTEEPLLRRPGEILAVRDGALASLLRDPLLGRRPSPVPPDAWPDRAVEPHAVALSVGRLGLYGPGPDGAWSRRAAVDLPIDSALVPRRGLRVGSEATFVGPVAGGHLLHATAPQSAGERRLRALAVWLSPQGEATSVEAWMSLPEPEQLIESRVLVADGRPLLLVTTKAAGKLDLFGEKRLRLYAFEPDRSRLGRPPIWRAVSHMNLWQEAHARLLDGDGDGVLDLVVAYWKGLVGNRVVLDLYRGRTGGGFDDVPVTTGLDVPEADRAILSYGADLTGDGRADLVLGAAGRLVVHAGVESKKGGGLVGRRPLPLPELRLGRAGATYVAVGADGGVRRWTAPSGPPLRFADLDGDGADELLHHVPGLLDELRLIDLAPAASPAPAPGS